MSYHRQNSQYGVQHMQNTQYKFAVSISRDVSAANEPQSRGFLSQRKPSLTEVEFASIPASPRQTSLLRGRKDTKLLAKSLPCILGHVKCGNMVCDGTREVSQSCLGTCQQALGKPPLSRASVQVYSCPLLHCSLHLGVNALCSLSQNFQKFNL